MQKLQQKQQQQQQKQQEEEEQKQQEEEEAACESMEMQQEDCLLGRPESELAMCRRLIEDMVQVEERLQQLENEWFQEKSMFYILKPSKTKTIDGEANRWIDFPKKKKPMR